MLTGSHDSCDPFIQVAELDHETLFPFFSRRVVNYYRIPIECPNIRGVFVVVFRPSCDSLQGFPHSHCGLFRASAVHRVKKRLGRITEHQQRRESVTCCRGCPLAPSAEHG